MNMFRSFLGYLINGWCGNGCDYQEPYGFVPECGCPVHDPEKWFPEIIGNVVLWLRPLPSESVPDETN